MELFKINGSVGEDIFIAAHSISDVFKYIDESIITTVQKMNHSRNSFVSLPDKYIEQLCLNGLASDNKDEIFRDILKIIRPRGYGEV
jgi:hypothetical protein